MYSFVTEKSWVDWLMQKQDGKKSWKQIKADLDCHEFWKKFTNDLKIEILLIYRCAYSFGK